MGRFELSYMSERNYIDPQGTQSWARPYVCDTIIHADEYHYCAGDAMIHFLSNGNKFVVFAIPVQRLIAIRELEETPK